MVKYGVIFYGVKQKARDVYPMGYLEDTPFLLLEMP